MSFETVVLLINSIVVPVVGWLVKQSMGRMTDRLERLESRTTGLEKDMDNRVTREDFIRETARTRNTLEKLVEGQARLEGKLDTGVRIAAAVERLTGEIGKDNEHGED